MELEKNKKVKICIFSLFGYALYNKRSEIPFGGAEVQLYLLSKQLAQNKRFKIHIILAKKRFKFNQVETFDNIDLHISIPFHKSFINYIKGGINLFLTLIKINPHIIIQRSGGIPTFLIALYCKIFRKKFIFSIASKWDVSKNDFSKLWQPFYNVSLNLADGIITQNSNQIYLLKKWKGAKLYNVKTIKSGYKITNESIDINDKKFILWVGKAKRWKGPLIFLELAKHFPNESFVMICETFQGEAFSDNIIKEAKRIYNLSFINFVPFEEINSYFKKAKVFINTSPEEGFPNTFIQAAKNKTPIISLNVNPENFLEKKECGFYCHNDLNILKEKLKILLTDKTIYKQISRKCYKYAKRNHDIIETTREWEEIVFKLI